MSKCLASFGVEASAPCAALSRPGMEAYAARHGYDLCLDHVPTLRPWSYAKIPLLIDLLGTYDEVLWLDADVLIRNGRFDVAEIVPGAEMHAMVAHHTYEGHVPNCGVWLLRKAALPMLGKVLALYDAYRHHKWWEQGAVHSLLGEHPAYMLTPWWNWCEHDSRRGDEEHACFRHYCGMPNRLDLMRRDLGLV